MYVKIFEDFGEIKKLDSNTRGLLDWRVLINMSNVENGKSLNYHSGLTPLFRPHLSRVRTSGAQLLATSSAVIIFRTPGQRLSFEVLKAKRF